MRGLSSIRKLRSSLQEVDAICSEILSANTRQVLFTSPDEKKHIYQKIAPFYPDEYFKFRLLEHFIQLCYNSRSKVYYIHYEFYTPSFDVSFFPKNDTSIHLVHSYAGKYDFHDAVMFFCQCCKDLVSQLFVPEILDVQ